LSAQTKTIGQSSSPDENAAGLFKDALDPLRYAGRILDPCVVSGIVVRMIPQGAGILNVGCGTGALTEIVRDTLQRLSLWRIEPDATRAAQAVAHGLNVRLGYLDRDLIREIAHSTSCYSPTYWSSCQIRTDQCATLGTDTITDPPGLRASRARRSLKFVCSVHKPESASRFGQLQQTIFKEHQINGFFLKLAIFP
jgi:hypothetical protein